MLLSKCAVCYSKKGTFTTKNLLSLLLSSVCRKMFIWITYKCYILTELMFLKVLILIRQVHLKNALFVTIGILKKRFWFQPSVCVDCHDILMLSLDVNKIVILNIDSHDYRCFNVVISKDKVINLFKILMLLKKVVHGLWKKSFFVVYSIKNEIITFGDITIEKRKCSGSKRR